MASENSGTDIKQFTCGICIEDYKTPRYLPTCGHTFCENCLFMYASNIQQRGSKLECPVCRKPHDLPEDTQVTREWVQTLPLNSVIIKMMDTNSELQSIEQKNVGEEVRKECDPCKEQGEAVPGLKFCMDCQEVYCKTCTESHIKFKMSKHHRLIDIVEISAEARHVDFFTSFTKCSKHPEREVEFYCRSHDVVFCSICALHDHHAGNACDTVDLSSHGIEDAKLRKDSEELTARMKTIIDHLDVLNTTRATNKNELKTKLKEIRENMKQVRDQIVKLMDDLVRHITEVTKQIEIENEDKIDEDISRVSKIKELAEEKFSLLEAVAHHGSERHQFISTHLMKEQMEEIEGKISQEDNRLRNIAAELVVSGDIRKLMEGTDVGKLAHVTVNECESSHKHLDAVSNYLRAHKLVRVEQHTVRPNADRVPYYWDVTMHKDGRIILPDYVGGYICLYNPANRVVQDIKLKRSYSATQIDDTRIAVSIPDDKAINIVAVRDKLIVEKTLKAHNTPWDIVALSNGLLAVAWGNPPAFGMIDISGTEIAQKSYFDKDKKGRKFRSINHLAVDEKRDHVIQPCTLDKAVYCFDFTGEPVFQYTNTGLTNPRGVALDKCGNIYICEHSSPGSIHKLSPEGELISIFTEGIPTCPAAICSDNSGAGFWVTQKNLSHDKIVYFRLEKNT